MEDLNVIRNRLLSRGEDDLAAAVEQVTAKGGGPGMTPKQRAAWIAGEDQLVATFDEIRAAAPHHIFQKFGYPKDETHVRASSLQHHFYFKTRVGMKGLSKFVNALGANIVKRDIVQPTLVPDVFCISVPRHLNFRNLIQKAKSHPGFLSATEGFPPQGRRQR
jgi:hypothetical protein